MNSSTQNSAAQSETPTSGESLSVQRIFRAFLGSAIAGGLSLLFYKLLSAIAVTFANKPVVSDNVTVVNLSAAVRTLVLGTIALGTGVFGMAAIGLLLLGGQMIGKRLKGVETIETTNQAISSSTPEED